MPHFLVLEDHQADARVLTQHPAMQGVTHDRHSLGDDTLLLRVVEERPWDAVIFDCTAPDDDFMQALALVRSRLADIPVILLSGPLGEERVVDLMKAGISDVILKSSPARLGPALQRAGLEILERRAHRNVEKALRDNEARLGLALAAGRMGVWEWDTRSDTLYWSTETQLIFGTHQTGISGEEFLRRLHPDDAPWVLSAARESVEKHSVFSARYRILRADGTERWLASVARTEYDPSGQAKRMVGTVTDITEQVLADHALKETQNTLKSFYDNSPFMMGVAELDGDHIVVVHGNRAVDDLLVSVLDQNSAQLPTEGDPVHDVHRLWVDNFRSAMQQRVPMKFRFSYPTLLGDRHISATAAHLGASAAGLPQFSFVAADVSDEWNAEKVLLDRESRYRAVIETSRDGFAVINRSGQMVEVNDAYVHRSGYPREVLLSMTIADLEARKSAEEVAAHLNNIRRYGHDRYESEHRARDGSPWPVEVTMTYWPIADGLFFVFFRDITRTNAVMSALHESEARANLILDTTPEAILVVDERGHILRANKRAEQVFGYESGDMWDLTVEALVPASVRVGHRLLRGHYAENPTPRLMEQNRDLRGLRKDGFEFPVEVGLAPMRSAGKLQFIVTVVDITTRKRAELELQRYAHIVETSGDMLAFIDGNERYELVNPAYAMPYQVTPERICGQFVKDFLDAASYAAIESRLKAALSGSNQHFVVTREVHAGTYRTLDVDYRVFKPDGNVLGIVAGIRDVTEQVAAEGALRENQRTLERAQAIAHVGSWIADLITGSFLGSAEARRIIGLPHGPVDAKRVFETCHPEDLPRVEAAWQAAVLGIAPYDIEHRIIVRGDIRWLHVRAEIAFDSQGRAVRALGVSQDITEVRTAQFALREQQRRLEELVAERTGELHEQARYLRALIDNFPFRVWLKDTRGRYLAANRVTADAFGVAVDDMEGKTDFDFYAREFAERRVASDAEVMLSHQKMTMEERLPAGDASAWFEIYKAPVLDLDGEVLGTVGFARDITAQKTLDTEREQSLSEAVRLAQLRSDFLANMSHEIRTPLNAVLGLAQVGLHYGPDRQAHDTFTRILESGQLLLGVINDILDFSKIESGKFVIEQAPINPGHSIDRAVGFVASQAFAKGLEFRVRESAALPDNCLGDELRIAQVLVNLLSNAIKFTREGHVFLDASADQDSLLFQISDSGIGMSVQQMTRLFQPFEQADSSTTRRFGGSGLGLAISRSLVERMGGTIRVESELGAGSTFEVSLPLINAASVAAPACKTIHMAGFADAEIRFVTAELGARGITTRVLSPDTAFDGTADLVLLDAESIDEATTRAANEAAINGQRLAVVCDPGHRHLLPDFNSDHVESVERPLRVRHILAAFGRTPIGLARAADHGPRLGGLHVLAAEDNEVNQLVLTEMLKMEGALVTFGANGLLALESMHAVGERSFDIVLADIQMPEMDGYQMARRIRQLAPTLPIVGLTAHAMPEERQRCLDVGMVAHLPKPIELEALVETIRHFSRRKPDASFPDGTPRSTTQSTGRAPTADALPVVDWAALNARFNNKSAFISKLTGVALDSYRSVPPKLTAAMDQKDFESITFIAHSLKGTSGNLQAKRLYGLAVHVEATSRAKNPEAFKMAGELLQAVDEVITELTGRHHESGRNSTGSSH